MQAIAFLILSNTLFGFEGAINFIVGADCGEGPPVPIPNTEVKLACAADTRLETGWKKR